jgi:hypothetical protein
VRCSSMFLLHETVQLCGSATYLNSALFLQEVSRAGLGKDDDTVVGWFCGFDHTMRGTLH